MDSVRKELQIETLNCFKRCHWVSVANCNLSYSKEKKRKVQQNLLTHK